MIFEKFLQRNNATTPERRLLIQCRIFDTMLAMSHSVESHSAMFTRHLEGQDPVGNFWRNLCTLAETARREDLRIGLAMRAQILNRKHLVKTQEEREAWGEYEALRKSDMYYTERRPSGPMAFEGDWSGVFVRGDEAMGIGLDLSHALEFVETLEKEAAEKGESRKFGEPGLWELRRALEAVQSLLSGANHHVNGQFRQNMKPFEECILGEYFEAPSIWDIVKLYEGEDAVTDLDAYLGKK